MRRRLPETQYRGSRLCRVLGNPTAYQVLYCLMKQPRSPSDLAEEIGLSLQTISDTLRNLRNVDIVRYDTVNKNKIYYVKDSTLFSIFKEIETFVEKMRSKEW